MKHWVQPVCACAMVLLLGTQVRAAHPVLTVPAPDSVPDTEPPPAGETAPPPSSKPPGKQRHVRVTIFPLLHPDIRERTTEPILRSLSEVLRQNSHLDMKDLEARLSDFAQEVPVDQIDLARSTYQKGREALGNLEMDAAVSQLQDAVDLLISVLPYIKKQELADAMLALAVAQLEKGSRRACNAALLRLLTWREDYQVDTSEFPERIVEPLDAARRALSRQARGKLRITTDPDGAQVFIDGRFAGITPVTEDNLLVGEHYLTFKKVGYKKALRVAQIGSRAPLEVQLKLAHSEKYLLVKQALDRVEKAMGQPRLDRVVDDLKETLFLDHAVFLRLDPGPPAAGTAPVRATAYLYDLRTRGLLNQHSALLRVPEDNDARLGQLGERLYAGVDYEGVLKPPAEPPPPLIVRKPLYKKWWFLTAVGAILAGTATAIAVGVTLTRTPSCPDGHVCTGPVMY